MEALLAGLGATTAAGWLIIRVHRLRARVREREEAFHALAGALSDRHAHTLDLLRLASGYLLLEAPLLEAVALARYYAMQSRTVLARTRTETDLCWALARLMLAAGAHPELTGHPRFRALARQVADAEDRAAAARDRFNALTSALAKANAGPLGRVLMRAVHAGAADQFDLDPTVAREAMMTLLKPRPAPEAVPAGGAPPQPAPRPAPTVASVAFGI